MNSRVLNIFLSVTSIIAVWVFTSTVVASMHYLRPGPGFDYWTGAMPFLQSAIDGPWQWPLLWEMYAGAHRLLVSRLLFLVDWMCGDFRGEWLLGFAWVAMVSSALIMANAVWKEKVFDATSRWICLLLIALGLGSAHHLNNLVYTFNQQWSSGLLLTLAGINGVIGSCVCTDKRKRIAASALALVSASLLALTTFSLLSIIVTWLTLCWLLQIRWQMTASVFIFLLIAFLWYASNLPLVASVVSDANIENPALFFLQALLFLSLSSLRYLSSPVAEDLLAAGIILGLLALSMFIIAARKQRRDNNIHPLLVMAIAYAAFVSAMALSTAVGRLEAQHAINPRFRTYVMPFLVFAGILFVYQIQHYQAKVRAGLSMALMLLALAIVIPGHFRQLDKFSDEYDLYLPGSIALASGLTDISVVHESRFLKFQQVDNREMLKYKDFMKNHRKGIFATVFYHQIGSSVALEHKQNETTGTLNALQDGTYIWKGQTDSCGADGRIAVANAQGIIIGSGMVNRKLQASGWEKIYKVFLPYCRPGHPVAWTAFVPAGFAPANHDATLYALVFDGQTPQTIAINTGAAAH